MKPEPHIKLLAAMSLFALPSFADETAKDVPDEKTAEKTEEKPAPPPLDFGDFNSQTLTSKAWEALTAGNHDAVDGYAGKCIEMYEAQAVEMQKGLTAAASADKAGEYWALNDVGTCYFIRAQSKEARGDTKAALADYKAVVDKLSYAQCWDTKGWFWQPADAARTKVKSLEFDALK